MVGIAKPQAAEEREGTDRMTLWQWLLGVETPPETSLHSMALSLRGLLPWWAALLLAVPAALGVLWLYSREQLHLGIARRFLLVGLRTTLVLLVLFLLLRPMLVAEFRGQRPRPVALLL